MPKRGFFFDLTDALENNANVHRELIMQIERLTKHNLVCYFANPGHPAGAMQDHDPDILENVLRSLDLDKYKSKLDLLVTSPGGFPYAAGKMVKVCKAFASEFRTIVLGRAMSAATLLCLGSEELLMGETGSLGPIDPQMVRSSTQGERLVPAHVIIESFREMVGAAQQSITAGQPADPFLHVLDSIDITAVLESSKAQASTKAIAKDILVEGLLRNDRSKIDGIVNALMAEGEKELHVKHLYPNFIQKEIGLPVTIIPLNSALDKQLRELHVRVEAYSGRKGIAKYLVTRQGGIEVQVQIKKI